MEKLIQDLLEDGQIEVERAQCWLQLALDEEDMVNINRTGWQSGHGWRNDECVKAREHEEQCVREAEERLERLIQVLVLGG